MTNYLIDYLFKIKPFVILGVYLDFFYKRIEKFYFLNTYKYWIDFGIQKSFISDKTFYVSLSKNWKRSDWFLLPIYFYAAVIFYIFTFTYLIFTRLVLLIWSFSKFGSFDRPLIVIALVILNFIWILFLNECTNRLHLDRLGTNRINWDRIYYPKSKKMKDDYLKNLKEKE